MIYWSMKKEVSFRGKTSSECTRVTRFKSEVQDSYPEKGRVSTEKSMSRQKKNRVQSKLTPFRGSKRFIGSQENHRIFTGKTIDIRCIL